MSDVITTTAELRVCTAETINIEALKIADMIKAGQACTDEQQALLAKAICDSLRIAKDYTAEQVSKVAEFSVATNDKVVELQEAIKKIEPSIALLTSIDATTLEKLTAIQEILSNDNIALQSLLSLKLDVSAIKEQISVINKNSDKTNAEIAKTNDKVITIEADIVKLKEGQQSDILCKLADTFKSLGESIQSDCDARKTKLNEALGCVTTPYTPAGEYQWAGNPADLSPSMTIPVLDTVVTPVTEQSSVTGTTVEVVTPEVFVEPSFVVSDSITDDGTLIEVLSDGNIRKTTIDGVTTTVNSMGDLV